ncbi:GNVR domain-containing protein [Listeria aquatica]|uniref:GNVR domain-containing protein n=1 Tax=Listeria aquatica TaxID=1494960 RepID=UPI001FD4F769|nr:GNVR domain-containing protein [Listeria aquatica]
MNIDNVTIISPSSYTGEETPIRPQKALMLLLSFFLGLVVAFLFIVIKMFFERTFTSIKEIEELLGLPILGEVSTFQKEELYLTEKEDLLRK